MTYAAELAARYSEARRRLWGGSERRNIIKRKRPNVVQFAWREIALQVADETGISLEDMRGPNRKRPYGDARRICWYRMRTEIPGASWSWIGQLFRRDKSTVVHGVHRYCIENNLKFPTGEQHGGKSKPCNADR